MKKINILLVIIWMIVIFLFSNQEASESTKVSNSLITGTINTVANITSLQINEKKQEEIIDNTVHLVRKSAHLTEYFILGILVLNALKDYYTLNKETIIFAILICFLYACSDEFHQLFIRGRSAEVLDTLIDTTGSFIGISLYNYIFKKINSKKV